MWLFVSVRALFFDIPTSSWQFFKLCMATLPRAWCWQRYIGLYRRLRPSSIVALNVTVLLVSAAFPLKVEYTWVFYCSSSLWINRGLLLQVYNIHLLSTQLLNSYGSYFKCVSFYLCLRNFVFVSMSMSVLRSSGLFSHSLQVLLNFYHRVILNITSPSLNYGFGTKINVNDIDKYHTILKVKAI